MEVSVKAISFNDLAIWFPFRLLNHNRRDVQKNQTIRGKSANSLSQQNIVFMPFWISLGQIGCGVYMRHWGTMGNQIETIKVSNCPDFLCGPVPQGWRYLKFSEKFQTAIDPPLIFGPRFVVKYRLNILRLSTYAFLLLSQFWRKLYKKCCRELVSKPLKLLFVYNLGIPLEVAGLQKPKANFHFSYSSSPPLTTPTSPFPKSIIIK